MSDADHSSPTDLWRFASELDELASMREEEIVNEMVSAFRSRKATNEGFWAGVAAISELRTLVDRAESQAKRETASLEATMN